MDENNLKHNLSKKVCNDSPHKVYAFAIVLSILIFSASQIYMQNKKFDVEKQKEQEIKEEKSLNELNRNICIDSAEEDYYELWNQNCKSHGQKNDCSLPLDLADSIEKSEKAAKDECFKKYPVD